MDAGARRAAPTTRRRRSSLADRHSSPDALPQQTTSRRVAHPSKLWDSRLLGNRHARMHRSSRESVLHPHRAECHQRRPEQPPTRPRRDSYLGKYSEIDVDGEPVEAEVVRNTIDQVSERFAVTKQCERHRACCRAAGRGVQDASGRHYYSHISSYCARGGRLNQHLLHARESAQARTPGGLRKRVGRDVNRHLHTHRPRPGRVLRPQRACSLTMGGRCRLCQRRSPLRPIASRYSPSDH